MITQLEQDLFSNNWETSLNAADRLAEIGSDESINTLIKALASDNNFTRNAAALGIRELNSKNAFYALYNRILELGPNEEIGTLLYGLETSEDASFLIELVEFFFLGNYEVKHSIKTIFDKQIDNLSLINTKLVAEKLATHKMTINDFRKLQY